MALNKGTKALVRRIMVARGILYTEALAELRELPPATSWKKYVEKVEEWKRRVETAGQDFRAKKEQAT